MHSPRKLKGCLIQRHHSPLQVESLAARAGLQHFVTKAVMDNASKSLENKKCEGNKSKSKQMGPN